MKKAILLVLFVLLRVHLFAQSEEEKNDNSYAKVSLKYTNDFVFMGRTDSLQAPYLTPSLAYFHKSGFFGKGAFSYLTSSGQNRIDLSIFSAGYNKVGKNIYGGGSISAYFFNEDSYAVPSSMTGFLNGYLGYDFQLFELSVDGSLGLSEDLDAFVGIEVLRTFYMLKNKLLITPSVYANAGSQNYYNEYYRTRNSKITQGNGYSMGSGKGSQNPTNLNTMNVVVEEESEFQILDYEFSLEITFKTGSWRMIFTPNYVIPVNPSTVRVDEAIVFEEVLDNVFYWSVGVGFIIE